MGSAGRRDTVVSVRSSSDQQSENSPSHRIFIVCSIHVKSNDGLRRNILLSVDMPLLYLSTMPGDILEICFFLFLD